MREHLIERMSHSPEETWAIAAEVAADLAPGAVIALHGNLGAGKTCFIQGLAVALDIHEPITSPTYTLIGEYEGRVKLVHIDLYRLSNALEAIGIGLEEYLQEPSIKAIEWAERAEELLPDELIHVSITNGQEENERHIEVYREVTSCA